MHKILSKFQHPSDVSCSSAKDKTSLVRGAKEPAEDGKHSVNSGLTDEAADNDSFMKNTVIPLPVDVWHTIFEFVSADGWRTLSALSRVSRAMHTISKAYQYRKVRLAKLSDIEKFVSSFDASRPSASSASSSETGPPRVRHLLLSFLPHETDMLVLEGAFHMRDYWSWEQAKEEWDERFATLLPRLLSSLGPHLDTLTVLQSQSVALPLVQAHLPALRSLTLLEEDRIFVRLPAAQEPERTWLESHHAGGALDLAAVAAAPPFPALERLHLVDGAQKAQKRLPWTTTLPVWALLAPRLARLRVSGGRSELLSAVRDAICAVPPAFPALRSVEVQLGQEGGVVLGLVAEIREACERGAGAGASVQFTDLGVLKVDKPAEYWKEKLVGE
ncbi:hypothetical protein BD413DRAFT_614191 [Trametes elegans]|nr:hypothetical protein BD413DRAFT_614191 [Trametes elegans]